MRIIGVRNVRFSENLACFVLLKHPFWDSPFCLITDESTALAQLCILDVYRGLPKLLISKICFSFPEKLIRVRISLYKRMKFSIKDFFSKCDQILRKLQIWSHLLNKSLMENFNFCAVYLTGVSWNALRISWKIYKINIAFRKCHQTFLGNFFPVVLVDCNNFVRGELKFYIIFKD